MTPLRTNETYPPFKANLPTPSGFSEPVVKRARAFFDSWLERFPAWPDFVQGCAETPLAEFGGTGETAIKQITEWLGGAAAIKEAEKMLREAKTVHDFNASFRHSRGLPSLLRESRCIDQYNGSNWREEEYQKAKEAIEPSGSGLGRGFIQHFLPANSVPNPNTLQTAIAAYYQERWREEGQKLLDESQLLLWQAKETNDQEKIAAALELEKQARVLLGKVKEGGVSRALLEKLDSTSKMGDLVRLVKDNHIPEQYHAELVELAKSWSADSQTTHKAGTSISIRGGLWWEVISGEHSERMRVIKERIRQQELTEKLGSRPVHKVAAEIISDYGRALRKTDEPAEHLKMAAEHFCTLREKELKKVQDSLIRLDGVLTAKANEVKAMIRGNNVLLQAREKEVNPSP